MRDRVAIAQRYGIDSVLRAVTALPQFRASRTRSPALRARLDTIIRSYNGRDLLEPRPQSGRYPAPTLEQMRRWAFPVLFVMGETEAALPHLVADPLTRWMPNARKVVIAGGGHGVHLDEPERFNETLLAFLGDVARAPAAPTRLIPTPSPARR